MKYVSLALLIFLSGVAPNARSAPDPHYDIFAAAADRCIGELMTLSSLSPPGCVLMTNAMEQMGLDPSKGGDCDSAADTEKCMKEYFASMSDDPRIGEKLYSVRLAGLAAMETRADLAGKERTRTARIQIEELAGALDIYRLEVGRYPTTGEGLQALVDNVSQSKNWHGPYLRIPKVPLDPWGYEYHYKALPEHGGIDIWSLGADNAEGGTGEDRDIHYQQ